MERDQFEVLLVIREHTRILSFAVSFADQDVFFPFLEEPRYLSSGATSYCTKLIQVSCYQMANYTNSMSQRGYLAT